MQRRSRSVAVHWAISYLLVLLIPLVTMLATDYVSSDILSDEIQKAHKVALGSVQSRVDRELRDAVAAYSAVYNHPLFRTLVMGWKDNDAQSYYDGKQLHMALSSYSSYTRETETWVYIKEGDYIINPRTANRARYLWGAQQFEKPGTLSYKEWSDLISREYNSEFFASEGFGQDVSQESIVFANTVHRTEQGYITIFVIIPMRLFADVSAQLSGGTFLMLDDSGAPLAQFGESIEEEALEPLVFPQEEGSFTVTLEKETYICTFNKSAQNDWNYAILIPESRFWERAQHVTMLNVVSVVISLGLGITLAWLLLRRNYKPVRTMLELMRGAPAKGNEFKAIGEAYTSLQKENRAMQDMLLDQQAKLLESHLLSRLKGRARHLTTPDAMAHFGLEFGEDAFVLAAISLSDLNEADAVHYDIEQGIRLVEAGFSSRLPCAYRAYRVEDGMMLFYLIQVPKDCLGRWKQDCVEVLQAVCDASQEQGIALTAALSGLERDFADISRLYRDVLEALEYKSIIGDSGVIVTDDLIEPDERFRKNRQADNESLFTAVCEGDVQSGQQIVDRVFAAYLQNTSLTFKTFRFMMLDTLNTVVSAFHSRIQDKDLRYKLMARLEQLMICPDTQEFHELIGQFLLFACHSVQNQAQKETPGLAQSVKDYIQKHYGDKNLNISNIASAMGRSSKYVSYLFKTQTGEGLLDYLNYIRISQAKRLMEEENVTQEELADRVGYTNVRTFRRAFAKMEGITPGKYAPPVER